MSRYTPIPSKSRRSTPIPTEVPYVTQEEVSLKIPEMTRGVNHCYNAPLRDIKVVRHTLPNPHSFEYWNQEFASLIAVVPGDVQRHPTEFYNANSTAVERERVSREKREKAENSKHALERLYGRLVASAQKKRLAFQTVLAKVEGLLI
jgi:hypothetical protein